jgi:hypothetical protein
MGPRHGVASVTEILACLFPPAGSATPSPKNTSDWSISSASPAFRPGACMPDRAKPVTFCQSSTGNHGVCSQNNAHNLQQPPRPTLTIPKTNGGGACTYFCRRVVRSTAVTTQPVFSTLRRVTRDPSMCLVTMSRATPIKDSVADIRRFN